MNDSYYDTQRAFLTAAGDHFGIPADQLMQASRVDGGDDCTALFQVSLVVALTPGDVTAIAARMQATQDEHTKQTTGDDVAALNSGAGG